MRIKRWFYTSLVVLILSILVPRVLSDSYDKVGNYDNSMATDLNGLLLSLTSFISAVSTIATGIILIRNFILDRRKKKLEIELLELDLAERRKKQAE